MKSETLILNLFSTAVYLSWKGSYERFPLQSPVSQSFRSVGGTWVVHCWTNNSIFSYRTNLSLHENTNLVTNKLTWPLCEPLWFYNSDLTSDVVPVLCCSFQKIPAQRLVCTGYLDKHPIPLKLLFSTVSDLIWWFVTTAKDATSSSSFNALTVSQNCVLGILDYHIGSLCP